jgi:hypothetical protein
VAVVSLKKPSPQASDALSETKRARDMVHNFGLAKVRLACNEVTRASVGCFETKKLDAKCVLVEISRAAALMRRVMENY